MFCQISDFEFGELTGVDSQVGQVYDLPRLQKRSDTSLVQLSAHDQLFSTTIFPLDHRDSMHQALVTDASGHVTAWTLPAQSKASNERLLVNAQGDDADYRSVYRESLELGRGPWTEAA